jgi:hypothetical protein
MAQAPPLRRTCSRSPFCSDAVRVAVPVGPLLTLGLTWEHYVGLLAPPACASVRALISVRKYVRAAIRRGGAWVDASPGKG